MERNDCSYLSDIAVRSSAAVRHDATPAHMNATMCTCRIEDLADTLAQIGMGLASDTFQKGDLRTALILFALSLKHVATLSAVVHPTGVDLVAQQQWGESWDERQWVERMSDRLPKLLHTTHDEQLALVNRWQLARVALALNEAACMLSGKRLKDISRVMHITAAELVLVSGCDMCLPVPPAADLMHACWHSGISYWPPSKDGERHGDDASVHTEPSSPPSSGSERVTLHARRHTRAAAGDPAPSHGTDRYHPRGRRVRRQRWKWNQ